MNKKLFFAILLLAFVLRFYKLGEVPFSLDWDENSNAYNAYSIIKTGRDEYGDFLPITNRSFDDYKPPLYMYLNVPSVAFFGLTPFAARLPSALFGFLTVPAMYFLAKKLFKKESIAQTSMFLLAISPWHLQFSRVGFESVVGLFTAVLAIVFFLYGLTNKKLLILSSIFLGLSAYSYHTQRIFVPLLFIAAFIIWKKEILALPKKYISSFIVTTVLIGLPLVVLIPPKVILQRFEVTTGRPRMEDIEKSIKFIIQDKQQGWDIGKIIHNRRLVIGQTYFGNYLSHFDFNFLFTKGDDNFRHHIQDMGMLYLFEFPLILFGIYSLIKTHNRASALILSWLLIAPIAATPATPNPHANRSLPLIIALELVAAYALVNIFSKSFKFKSIAAPSFYLWMFFSFAFYLHSYWVHYPIEKASFWQYGYKEAVFETEKLKDQYEKVYIDKKIEQAYAFWLFNTRYDPSNYQKEGSRYHFDKYYFDIEGEPKNNQILYVSEAEKFPDSYTTVKTINFPDGTPAVKIGHNNN